MGDNLIKKVLSGPAAVPANIGFTFKNIPQRDTFFTANLDLLETDLVIQVKTGKSVTTFEWTGLDNPATYDAILWSESSLNTGPGALFLGEDAYSLSSAAKVVNVMSAYGDKGLVITNFFSPKGSIKPFEFRFEKERIQLATAVFDTQLSAPRDFSFAVSVSTYTESFLVRPATAGTLTIKGFAGTSATDPIILDVAFTVVAGDIGNKIEIPFPNGLLATPVDLQFLVFDGVDLFGGLQTDGIFSGQTKPFLEAKIHILEPIDIITRNDLDQYALLNHDHTGPGVKNGGMVVVTNPTGITDTFTNSTFTAGVAGTSNPTVITDTAGKFAANDLVLILHGTDLLDSGLNDGLYEVLTHVGTTLTIKGVGTVATTEDFVKDQFIFLESTGTITNVGVSILRITDSGIETGFGLSTPMVFELLPRASEVPTVITEKFASTDARFFGELGLPATQQTWVDTATGSASIDLITGENVFGVIKDVILHNDNSTNGSTTSKILLTSQNWTDINAFGASYGGTPRLGTVNGSNGFFSGLQVNAAENPLATGNRRYGLLFNSNAGILRITEADNTGNNVTFDGTGGNPSILFDEYFNWECVVPAGLGAAEVFLNGVLTTFVPTFQVNGGGLGTQATLSSGSTGGAGRVVFHDNFGVTIYEDSATKTLAVATMDANVAQIFIPPGKRDYTVVLPDGNPRNLGDVLAFIAQNVGGKVTVKTQDVAVPKSLFVGENELDISITVVNNITLINTVDNANTYEFGIPPIQPDELTPLYVSTADATILNTTIAKTIIGAGEGSLTVARNSLAVGDCFQFRAGGLFSAVANPTLRLKLKFGTLFVGDTTAIVISNITNGHWVLNGTATIRSIGATGTISVEGAFTTSAGDHFAFVFLVPTIVDTTINNQLDMTAQWGTANAGNTMTGQNVSIIKVLSP